MGRRLRFDTYKALTFDCYGTLIDWETGISEALKPLTSRLKKKPLKKDRVLQIHAHYEASQQSATPNMRYSDLLAVVYRRIAEEWNVPVSWEECETYGNSVGNWPTFPDSADALARLKERYMLVILSNVDNASFQKSNERLGVEFDAVFTAQDIGSYKPHLQNFEYMLNCLARRGIGKHDILHVAESMFHDHAPANELGIRNCWIHRRSGKEGFGATKDPGKRPRYDLVFRSMADLAEAVTAEQ